jgi:hypothetical protein
MTSKEFSTRREIQAEEVAFAHSSCSQHKCRAAPEPKVETTVLSSALPPLTGDLGQVTFLSPAFSLSFGNLHSRALSHKDGFGITGRTSALVPVP